MAKQFANSEDPDQIPHYVASDLGLQFDNNTFGGLQTKMGYGREI